MSKKHILIGCTAVLSFITTFTIFGTVVANRWEASINDFLKVQTSQIVSNPNSAGEDTEYFKSEFGAINEENQKKLVDATYTQNVNEMKEGAALLKNEGNALPLKNDAHVSFFGHATVEPFCKGVSAGSAPTGGYNPTLYEAMKDEGFGINNELINILKGTGTHRGSNFEGWSYYTYGASLNSEDPISTYDATAKATWASDYQDAAIVSLAREGGEHEDMDIYNMKTYSLQEKDRDYRYNDRAGRDSALALIPEEKDMFSMLKAEKAAGRLKKIVVVLNTASAMEVNWLDDYDVDACIFAGSYGSQGTRGIASILAGKTNPSGHLVDTYAKDSRSAPAVQNFSDNTPIYANYAAIAAKNQEASGGQSAGLGCDSYFSFQAESIYIGYRYYETRYEDSVLARGNASSSKGASFGASSWKYQDEVDFPFGHGLSYTTFEQKIKEAKYNSSTDMYEVKVEVTNKGNMAGKSVVQVYAQTPYNQYEKDNKIEKSAVSLVGFEKTKELAKDESETVTVNVERYLLASYDYTNTKGYVISEGDNYLAIGDSSHDALNNIIKTKASATTGLINYDGSSFGTDPSDKVYSFHTALDTTSYQLSSAGKLVTNRFDDCDLNYWIKDAAKYLSRSDWDATYPTTRLNITATDEMMKVLKGDYYEKAKDAISVEEAKKNLGKDEGITFVTMKDVDWDDTATWEKFMRQFTLDELIAITECKGGRAPVASVGLPQTKVGDGCDGIGGILPFDYEDTTGKWGTGKVVHDVSGWWPSGMNTTRYASKTILTGTWNKELYARRGQLEGEEGLWTGCSEAWSIGADLHRTPFGGRNFEYMSECPNMDYMAAVPEVIGMQSKGMLAGVKHFAANDQEWQRDGVSTFFNEQAFREGSLRAFEGALRVAQASSLMQSFSRIGMKFASSCSALNIDVCNNEWGFKGHKETDGLSNAATGYLSHYVTMIASGTDTFCYTENTAKAAINNYLTTSDDGGFVDYLLDAGKHFCYAMSRSCPINGLASDSKVVKVEPWWRVTLVTIIVISSIITLICMGSVIYLEYKSRKPKGKEN